MKFQPHYHNSSNQPGVLDEFYTNYVTFKYPNNLYSQSSESITGVSLQNLLTIHNVLSEVYV